MLAGAATVVASASSGSELTVRLPAGDGPVNAGAASAADIRANNSPTVVRNPRAAQNMAIVNRIDGPRYGCALHVSFDAGERWSRVPIEIPKGEEPKCFAPDAAFTADGRLHVSFVTLRGRGNVPHAGWIVSSRDGGRTLSEPRRLLGPLSFQVRLAAHPTDPRLVYLSWLRATDVGPFRFASQDNPILVARSSDGGATWERPVRVSPGRRQRVVAPSPAVGPGGEVYVLYLDLGEDRLDYEGLHEGRGGRPYSGRFTLVLARSRDRGATWEESEVDDRVVPTDRFVAFLPAFPSLAIHPKTGRVYAGYHDARLGNADVYVWSRGADAGSWEGPARVNDTPERDGTSQYMPKLAVAPNGRLDVVYYDRRSSPRDVRNEVSLQSSLDGGDSFGPRVRLSRQTFDVRVGYGNERGMPDLGSRLGLLADDDSALAVWTDTRAGTRGSNKQDIARAVAVFRTDDGVRSGTRGALRYGGAAAVLVGVGLAMAYWRRRLLP